MASWPGLLLERFVCGDPYERLYEILDLAGSEEILDESCGSGFYTVTPSDAA